MTLLDRVHPVFIGMGHYRRVGIPSRGRDLPLTAYICEEVEGTVLSGTFPLLTEAYIFTPHPALEYWTLYYESYLNTEAPPSTVFLGGKRSNRRPRIKKR